MLAHRTPHFKETPMKLIRIALILISAVALGTTPALASHFEPIRSFQGSLDEGYTLKHYITLYAGYEYRVEADCDGDCSDLDLQLFDMYGKLSLFDTNSDDTPTLNFQVNQTGEFIVKVVMSSCSREPCDYSVTVSER